MKTTGKREIAENVLTAILCTLAASLIEIGVSSYKERRRQSQEATETPVKAKRKKRRQFKDS